MPPAPSANPTTMGEGNATPQPMPPKLTNRRISIPLPKDTFGWELNLYCLAVLIGVYKLTPPDLRVYFYGLLCLFSLDAALYYQKRGTMAGVPYTLPLVTVFAVIIAPVRFWTEQLSIAMESRTGMSSNSILGTFMVYVTDTKLCREVMTGESTWQFYAHPYAYWLFGEFNLIHLKTDVHKRFRKLLAPSLFSQEALRLYAEGQERMTKKHLSKIAEQCAETGEPLDIRIALRIMAAEASQESFLGPYLTDENRKIFTDDILAFTLGFLCFPFPYFNTGLAKAIAARKRMHNLILGYVPEARKNAQSNKPPQCLLDFWAREIALSAKEQGIAPEDIPGCSDEYLANTVMDFLFAAQDATNSAMTFALDCLEPRPDIVQRIRHEVGNCLSDPDASVWSSLRDSDGLKFTKKTANQMLHHKPPVPMIPYKAKSDTSLGGHFIPKGTIVIPSIYGSAKSSGTSLVFDPDREDADPQFIKTVTFGAGQHKCPGRRYAEAQLAIFIAICLSEYDFERVGRRPEAHEIMFYPTLFPSENKFIIKKRQHSG